MPDHSGHNRHALLWSSVHACHCFVVEPCQKKGCLHQDIKLGWIWHVRSLENCGVYFPRLYKKPSEDSHCFFCDFNPRFTVALVQRSLTYSEGVSVILYCECYWPIFQVLLQVDQKLGVVVESCSLLPSNTFPLFVVGFLDTFCYVAIKTWS